MSEKYSYSDVIIDPEDPRVEIGKEYYFGNNPTCLLKDISQLSAQEGKLMLKDSAIEAQSSPFMSSGNKWFVCLIRKKEYTENDIITDVSDPRLKDAIGKTVYVAHKLYGSIVDNANNNDSAHKGVLVNLGYDPSHPFEVHTELGLHWDRIILSKNQPPRRHYVPFDLSDAVVREQLWGKRIVINEPYSIIAGKTFKREIHSMITGFTFCTGEESEGPEGDWEINAGECSLNAEEALKYAHFYDETPCGRLVEEDE